MLPTSRDLSRAYDHVEIVVREVAKDRLDRYLQVQLAWKSRSKVQKLIQLGRVELNGATPKAATRVQRGDRIRIALDPGGEATTGEQETIPPPVWEDAFFVAINKPPHRLVHPVGRTVSGTVINELHHRYQRVNERGLRPIVPKLCHRLDRETSGLLLVAKTDPARSALSDAFEHGRVRKQYLAVVEGEPSDEVFEVTVGISADLDPHRERSNRLAKADPSGRPALTRFVVLARRGTSSVVACFPHTGRQNQIRVHLAHAGHPILGDWGYGSSEEHWSWPRADGEDDVPYPDRALLHSLRLRFRHPIWQTPVEVEAPPAPDFAPFTNGVELVSEATEAEWTRSAQG